MTERAEIESAAGTVRRRMRASPEVGLILGSGLGALSEAAEVDAELAYTEIPHFPIPTASGHRGRLALGRLEGRRVAILVGRAHLYEGYTARQVAFPTRVLAALGIRTLVVTNAAGGIARRFRPGDLMAITDHINFMGTNPLVGPNDDALGPRFPDMGGAYDPALVAAAVRAARGEKIPLRRGVYVGVAGPSYETPAELAMLARWGADAVGTSTVPEVIAARHAGMRVLGISAITNVVGGAPPAHDAVLLAAHEVAPRLVRLIRRILRGLPG